MIFAGLTLAAPQATSYKLASTLNASAEVPKPNGVKAGRRHIPAPRCRRRRTGGDAGWKLKFARLNAPPRPPHPHRQAGEGRERHDGALRACKSSKQGAANITNAQLKTIRAGRAYVNVHTATNAAGEIRGQVKAKKDRRRGSLPPPPPPPPPPGDDPPKDPSPVAGSGEPSDRRPCSIESGSETPQASAWTIAPAAAALAVQRKLSVRWARRPRTRRAGAGSRANSSAGRGATKRRRTHARPRAARVDREPRLACARRTLPP